MRWRFLPIVVVFLINHSTASLIVYHFTKDLPPFRRLSRRRGGAHVVRLKFPLFITSPHSSFSTRCIKEIELGRLPEWTSKTAPPIAIDYWRLAPDAKLLDVIYAVRSDESTHRFVNHSLANLDAKTDVNPFALREPDMHIKGKKLG